MKFRKRRKNLVADQNQMVQGKTTTFYMTVGLIKPDTGAVFFNDLDITKLPMYERAKLGIGYLPQEALVFRKMSVEDNIASVLELTKQNDNEQKLKLESLLDEFRLTHVRKSMEMYYRVAKEDEPKLHVHWLLIQNLFYSTSLLLALTLLL